MYFISTQIEFFSFITVEKGEKYKDVNFQLVHSARKKINKIAKNPDI